MSVSMPKAKRLSSHLDRRMVIRFAIALEEKLEEHRLYAGDDKLAEGNMPLLNRLLARLKAAIEDGAAPPEPNIETDPLLLSSRARMITVNGKEIERQTWTFKPRLDCLSFMKQVFDRIPHIEGESAKLNYLFAWAARLPVLDAIADSQELIRVMIEVWGEDKEIQITDLLQERRVVNRISIAALRIWIAELKHRNQIKLHTYSEKYPEQSNSVIVPFAIAIPTGKRQSQRQYVSAIVVLGKGSVKEVAASNMRAIAYRLHPTTLTALEDRAISLIHSHKMVATVRLRKLSEKPFKGDRVLDLNKFTWEEWTKEYKAILKELKAGSDRSRVWVKLRNGKTVVVFTPAR